MKTAAFLIAAILLSGVVCAQSIVPALASSSSVILDENGSVRVSPGVFYSLSINLSIPSLTSYQKVQSADEPVEGADGNYYLPIVAKGPENYFFYSHQMAVQTSARSTSSLPASFSVPAEYAKYLSPTNRTQSGDAEIQKAAQEAVAGAGTPFEKVARLAMFVNSHMQYDSSLVGQQKDARWVLDNGRGVCVEYSTLFIALARASGIPARYVTGYSYSDRFQGWMGHAWAEAYVGEWVPVDPTWFEAGSLDALHIEEGKYPELSTDATLSATVSSQYSKVKWESNGQGGAAAGNIKTLQLLSAQPDGDYSLSLDDPVLPLGGTTTVTMSIPGTDYRVLSVALLPCTGESRVDVANSSQYVVLEPGRNVTITWKITAPASLDPRYTYSCPLALNSQYLSLKTITVQIDPRAAKQGAPVPEPGASAGAGSTAGANNASQTPDSGAASPSVPPAQPSQAEGAQPSQQAGSQPAPCLFASLISIAALLIVFAKN